MKKLGRNYSQKTIKVLFALSGNQCAFPDCENAVIEPATEKSDAIVSAQISHIYAISEDGPRGMAGLTNEELNAPDNLLLLCPTHHVKVDRQYETYPASTLLSWKKSHEAKIQKKLKIGADNTITSLLSNLSFPIALIDQKIEEDVNIIRKSRFFQEYNRVDAAHILVNKVVQGEFAGGSYDVKCKAFAWCARILCGAGEIDTAEECYRHGVNMGSCPEILIANAFIRSNRDGKDPALKILAGIDTPASRSAALFIVANLEGPSKALEWVQVVGIDCGDLDVDGKYFLLLLLLHESEWEIAFEYLKEITANELAEVPALNHLIAVATLLGTVPIELRSILLQQVPFNAANFPLSDDGPSLQARKIAHDYFLESCRVARQYNCPQDENINNEYALWLELRDPNESTNGIQRLESLLRDPKSSLRFVHLGVEFRVKLDLEAIQRRIEREISLQGGMTHEVAIAQFALLFVQETPQAALTYLSLHYGEFERFIEIRSLKSIEAELLAKSGFYDRAQACFEDLIKEGVSADDERRLRNIIDGNNGSSSINAYISNFVESDSISDLIILVEKLVEEEDWSRVRDYSGVLFQRTHSVADAIRFASALNQTCNHEELVDFLNNNVDLLSQSCRLRMLYCWSLYYIGALVEARLELSRGSDCQYDVNYRNLLVQLAISTGDWSSLSTFVANEWNSRVQRTQEELYKAAEIAFHLDLPHAKELLFAAVGKGQDDVALLTAAYFLASKAGIEEEPIIRSWLHKAAKGSSSDGPIRTVGLKELVEQQPAWDQHESEVRRSLNNGEITMSLAAQSLNLSLVGLVTLPALINLSQSDIRMKSLIPAYSGKRKSMLSDIKGVIGIDASALLTLSFLDVIDIVLDAFDNVRVPHSTLTWLFEEKSKSAFHQPTRIENAVQLRSLLAIEVLEKFVQNTTPDSMLSSQIGENLAQLIAEAESCSDEHNTQHLVVISGTVHRIGSLMEEQADLTDHAKVLSSCKAIVDRLFELGHITAEHYEKSNDFFQLHNDVCPEQPKVKKGATLYLDDLSLKHFLRLELLDKLKKAGFRLVISPRSLSEINELIAHENILSKVGENIERIRSALNSRIESGKVVLGKKIFNKGSVDESTYDDPTLSILSLAKECSVIIVDDRCLNQHAHVKNDDLLTPVYSVFDVLEELLRENKITSRNMQEYRSLLRQAGFALIPISEDEVRAQLLSSPIEDGRLQETAELRFVRESILRVRMSSILQLPDEAHWLNTTLQALIRVLRKLWDSTSNVDAVKERSNWILDQIDVRGWAGSLGGAEGENLISYGRGAHLLLLFFQPKNPDLVDKYWDWLDSMVLCPLEKESPELYSWLVDTQRSFVSEATGINLNEE